ncbi:hypothetical protein [Ramlibacter sp.]|uniref:hypothetical protein n=1 Tax=Ramlibacter sp. TaxID=1917967 RepID=UPI002D073835|nr:hypothetical protein [Ramlibacter sp.]HWI82997.1 hypothetical protein [Ramlibacter sp.]
MLWRVALLLTAALLIGTAIGVVMEHGRLAFWLMAAAGFLGSWGLCPLSRPLLKRHRDLAAGAERAPEDAGDDPTP